MFATQTWVPSEETASGPLNPSLEPERTWTRAPVEALSSVTELALPFVTQTWVPSEEMALGRRNP